MPKTNFTKVEEALEQGLRKMNVEHLFEISDELSGKQPKEPTLSAAAPEGSAKPKETPLSKAQKSLINALQRDLKRLQIKEHREMYAELGIKKTDLKKKINTPTNLTPEEWEQIKQIKEKIDNYKQELQAKLPVESNEKIVESQRSTHINKRFNVHDGWLPLH